MVQTLSKHSPEMVLKSKHSIDMGLKASWLSLENFRALAGPEVHIGQTESQQGSNMALAWLQKVDYIDMSELQQV